MDLSIDQLNVTSFSTTEPVSSPYPYTQEVGCYSPLCMPTMVQTQCPETGSVAV